EEARESQKGSGGMERAMVFKWLAERFTALCCAISPPASWKSSAKKVVPSGRISILRGVRIGLIPLRDIGPADTNALGLFKYVYDDQYRRRRPFVFGPESDILSRVP